MDLDQLLSEKGFAPLSGVKETFFRERSGFIDAFDNSVYPIYSRITKDKLDELKVAYSNHKINSVGLAVGFLLASASPVLLLYLHSLVCNPDDIHTPFLFYGGIIGGIGFYFFIQDKLPSVKRSKKDVLHFAKKLEDLGAHVRLGSDAVNALYF